MEGLFYYIVLAVAILLVIPYLVRVIFDMRDLIVIFLEAICDDRKIDDRELEDIKKQSTYLTKSLIDFGVIIGKLRG